MFPRNLLLSYSTGEKVYCYKGKWTRFSSFQFWRMNPIFWIIFALWLKNSLQCPFDSHLTSKALLHGQSGAIFRQQQLFLFALNTKWKFYMAWKHEIYLRFVQFISRLQIYERRKNTKSEIGRYFKDVSGRLVGRAGIMSLTCL